MANPQRTLTSGVKMPCHGSLTGNRAPLFGWENQWNSVPWFLSFGNMNSHSSLVHSQKLELFLQELCVLKHGFLSPWANDISKYMPNIIHPTQWSGHIEPQPHIHQSAAWIWAQTSSNAPYFFPRDHSNRLQRQLFLTSKLIHQDYDSKKNAIAFP